MASEDRTAFLIELAAKFTGGDSSIAQLATIGDKMLAAGASAVEFDKTIKGLSAGIEGSASALESANAALKDGQSKYSQMEAAADRAAKAVERLNASGKSGAEFERRQVEAVSKANSAAAALKSEAVQLDHLQSEAAAAAHAHKGLTDGLKNVKSAAEQAAKAEEAAKGSGKVNEIAEAFGKLGGPAGVAGQKIFGLASGFKKLGAGIGSAGPYIAMAAVIVAVATAAIFATAAITKWSVGLADANRTQALLADGVAGSVAGGRELDATIAKLGNTVPQTREELLGMAGDLAKTGLKGAALSEALETAAIKAAKLKFGPDFAKQMLSLDNQSKRFASNLSATFGGLKIEGLLGGISTLVALFDSSTESGKALKFLFESLFQPIVDGVTAAIPYIERLFLYAEILALKAYIALKPYSEIIKDLAIGFGIAAAVLVGTLGVAIALVFGGFALAILGPFVLLGLLIAAIYAAGKAIYEGFGGAVTFMTDLGSNMVQGLINGITGGATAVVNAMKGVVGGAVDAAKHALGIASPSKVFEGIGDYTAAGFAKGVDGGAGDAQGSLEAMVAPPGRTGGAKAGAGGGVTLHIENVNVNGENGKEQAFDFIEQVTRLLELDSLQLGGGEVPA